MTNVSMNEMNTLNSAFDADEVKLSDLEALDLVLQKPETRSSFLQQIERLVKQKELLNQQQEQYKQLVSSTKEAFRFKTSSFISSTVESIVKDKLADNIALSTAEADLLSVVQEYLNS